MLQDDVIARRLCWDGVERALVPMEQGVGGDEVLPLPPRAPAQEREGDAEETSSYFAAEVPESSDESP